MRIARPSQSSPVQKPKKILKRILYYFLAVVYIVGSNAITIFPVSAAECAAVEFVFARGSGESINGPSYQSWHTTIEQRMQSSPLSYHFYELGSSSQDGYQYPATSVSGDSSGVINLIGAAISGGELFDFGKSVDKGEAELKAYISSVLTQCPNTKFVLGGYSQGAMLVARALSDLDASKIIYVATFGDPKLYLPEGKRHLLKKPDACYGRNLSDYRINVGDCYAYEGVLGSYRPYQPEDYSGKIGVWCNKNDIMCSSRLSVDNHTSYVTDNLYDEAASMIANKISEFFGVYATTAPKALHEVAFLVDNTISMKQEQKKYKNAIGAFAERVIKSGGRIALYEFGDLAQNVKTLERCGFGCEVDEFKREYNYIDANRGGDDPESALSGLMTTMNSLKWTNGATKSIVLLTDAGYHDPDFDGVTLDDVVERSLQIDPVNVYIIDTSSETDVYSELVERTNGGFIKTNCSADDLWGQIVSRPVAKLKLMEYQAEVGSALEFDASESYAEDGSDLHFEWDLDGDGKFERLNASSVVSQTYSQDFDGYAQVKVTDGNNNSATMSAHVKISDDKTSEELARITNFSSQQGEQNEISFSTTGQKVLLTSEDAALGWIELSAGNGEISIGQLKEDTKFSLVPYSKAGLRGERYDFILTASQPSIQDTITQQKVLLTDSAKSIVPKLPKVPNAGVYSNDR